MVVAGFSTDHVQTAESLCHHDPYAPSHCKARLAHKNPESARDQRRPKFQAGDADPAHRIQRVDQQMETNAKGALSFWI